MEQHLLEQYIKEHRGTVFRLAYSYVKNRENADDITQDVFMRLFTTAQTFADDAHVKAWLIRVTVNLAKDMLKSGWYRSREELPDNIPVETREEQWLLESVKRLKPEYAAVIYLFYYEGYSVKEIAALRRTTSSAVKTRLNRARNQLRELLTKEEL